MKMTVFWFACAVLALVPPYFIWNEVYKDGIIGRLALALISFTAWSFIASRLAGREYNPSEQHVLMYAAFALFMVWHLCRFHWRVVKKNKRAYPPDCPVDRRRLPDRRFQ